MLLCTPGGWADALIFCPVKRNKEKIDSEHTDAAIQLKIMFSSNTSF